MSACRRCSFVYPWGDAERIARITVLNGLCPACFTGKPSPARRDELELLDVFVREAEAAIASRRPAPRAPRVGTCLRCGKQKELMTSGDCRACYWAGVDVRRAIA